MATLDPSVVFRKLRKLKRDPASFFKDSRIGRILAAQAGASGASPSASSRPEPVPIVVVDQPYDSPRLRKLRKLLRDPRRFFVDARMLRSRRKD